MRFFTTLVSSALLLVLANAQTNATSTTAVVSSTASLSPAQSSEAACLAACSATDPNCRAKCIVVSAGDYAQQNATVDCISACPQGNGTAAENQAYENCQKNCLVSATVTSATTTASGTGATATGAGATTGGAQTTGASGSNAGGVSTATSSSSPSSTSKAAAETLRVGASVAGALGVFAAVFAL